MGTIVLDEVEELETIKISELSEIITPIDSAVYPTVQNSQTRIISNSNLFSNSGGFGSPTELTISGGIITVSGKIKFRFHNVDTESDDATDDLDTINGGYVGNIIILQAEDSTRTVICKNGTGLKLQADFSLNNIEDKLILLCISAGVWHELTRANNGA